jgi:hypothetical protein
MLRAGLLCVAIALLAFAALSPERAHVEAQTAGGTNSHNDAILSWPGDTTCDDAVDPSDAVIMLQYLVRLLPFGNCLRGSDVTCDGTRNALDVLYVLRYSAALSTPRPKGCPPIGPQDGEQFDALPAGERQLVTQARDLATTFFLQHFVVSTNAFSIIIDPDLEALAQKYASYTGNTQNAAELLLEQQGVASSQTAFFIYSDHSLWQNADAAGKQRIIVHQLFRILANELVGLPGLVRGPNSDKPFGGPQWLIEGAAAHVASVVVTGQPVNASCGEIQAAPTLQNLETWNGMKSSQYGTALGATAVDYLVDREGTKSLAVFWFDIGEGSPWQEAFVNALGRTSPDFYPEFAVYRDDLC